MSFHTSYMTCLPEELILEVFDMCDNVNDIINLAESDQYVFAIYKANIDKVVKQLINKSQVYNIIWSFYYNKYYNNNIDTKLASVKKIGNYLSNIDPSDLNYISCLKEGGDVEKVFELHKEHTLNISNAVDMINDFNEEQIEQTIKLIHRDFDSEIAYNLVEKFSYIEIELIIELSQIITKDYILEELLAELSTFWNASETELIIMITLLENNFNEDNISNMASALYDFHNYNESHLNKCIELKKKGINEEQIYELLEAGICIDFDDEYYDSLIKNNHSSEEAIDIIIARDND